MNAIARSIATRGPSSCKTVAPLRTGGSPLTHASAWYPWPREEVHHGYLKLGAHSGDAVCQAIALGELVHLDTASEELTDVFVLFAVRHGRARPGMTFAYFSPRLPFYSEDAFQVATAATGDRSALARGYP